MHEGVPCSVDPSKCCYNESLWCPNGGPHCDRYDRGAYPVGDKAVFVNQMTDPDALSPFPNAIIWNWVTILATAVGSIGTLDIEARCLAGESCTSPILLRPDSNSRRTQSQNLVSIVQKQPKIPE
jgi:hypothetical protein